MIRKIEYLNFPNCFELSNEDAKLIVSTDFGPRILSYSLDDGENIFGWHGEAAVNTELGVWKPYGGHRLWIAPENMPLSYSPDNDPVEYSIKNDLTIELTQPLDPNTGTQKRLTISLDETGSEVTVDHKVTNQSPQQTEISAWALTIMRPGGEVLIPNHHFKPYSSENLLPVRSLALWSYTDFTDPRWNFRKDCIRLRIDEKSDAPQKIGIYNEQGWAAYEWQNFLFVKRFDFVENSIYPDFNSNMEVYTAGSFVEIETLSPQQVVGPGVSVEHQEKWELLAMTSDRNASDFDCGA